MITLSHFNASLFGDNIITYHETYTTKERHECAYEIHQRFVDVQYLTMGQEYIDIIPPKGLTLRAPFDADKDIAFYNEHIAPDCRVTLRPGLYCVIFPWEAHMPCIAVNSPMEVQKHVAKIPLDAFMRVFTSGALE